MMVIGGIPSSLVNFRGPLLQAIRKGRHELIACAPAADEDVQRQLADWRVQYRDVPIQRAGMNQWRDMLTLGSLVRLYGKFSRTWCLPTPSSPLSGVDLRPTFCLPVHIFGYPCRVEELIAICNDYNIPVIEDAAESLGSYVAERHTGTFGQLWTLSSPTLSA